MKLELLVLYVEDWELLYLLWSYIWLLKRIYWEGVIYEVGDIGVFNIWYLKIRWISVKDNFKGLEGCIYFYGGEVLGVYVVYKWWYL